MNIEQIAALGYEAYVKKAGGKSLVTGTPLPSWEALSPAIKEAWVAAADQIVVAVSAAACT